MKIDIFYIVLQMMNFHFECKIYEKSYNSVNTSQLEATFQS